MDKEKHEEGLVARAKADLSRQVVRLQDELEAMIKMTSHQRKSLEHEMMADFEGHKKQHADSKVLVKLNSLAKTADLLVAARVRLDKHLKQLADTMSPEEEKKAVEEYIKSLEANDRGNMLLKLLDWHRKKVEAVFLGTDDTSS